jgi:hypothetical protein
VTVYDRVAANERADTSDGATLFPWRADCQFANEGWGCSWHEVFYTKEAAEWAEGHHEHFKTYQQSRYNYMSIAERYWVELDSVMDQLFEEDGGKSPLTAEEHKERFIKLQGRASGLAFALVHACQPYYTDEKAIAREAKKRWKIRNQQIDWEPTPGFKYDPPIPGAAPRSGLGGPDDPVRVNTARVPGKPAGVEKLKPAELTAIKQGMGSGMFKAIDLAKVYGTTVSVVEYVAKN